MLDPIEASIHSTLLPKLTGKDAPNEVERCLFSLPAHLGGLNIANPSAFADMQFQASQKVTKLLVDLILSDDRSYPYEVLAEQIETLARETSKQEDANKVWMLQR